MKRLLCRLALGMLGTTPLVYADTLNYNFGLNWNLIGNSLDTPQDVRTLYGDASKFQTVWKWDAANKKWLFYAPSLDSGTALSDYAASHGYGLFNTINPGEGYWVNVISAGTSIGPFTGGAQPLGAGQLLQGWNLVATGQSHTAPAFNRNLSGAASGTPENLTTLWAWDNATGKWLFYAPSLDGAGTLATYQNGKGYLDFGNQTLNNGRGFWVNFPGAIAGGVNYNPAGGGNAFNFTPPPAVSGNDASTGPSAWDQGIHPRIWMTPALRDKVRGYAKKPNSLFSHLKKTTDAVLADIQSGYIPGQCLDGNGDGFQDWDANGWNLLMPWDGGSPSLDSGQYNTEMYAQLLAFMAQIAPQDTPAEIALVNQYKTKAHDLIMAIMANAKLGPYDELNECVVPQQAANPKLSAYDASQTCYCKTIRRFRSPKGYQSSDISPFLSGDRGFVTGDALPTAVDWVYDTFSPAELKDIRQVFAMWAEELVAKSTGPAPRYTLNSDATLQLDDPYLFSLRFAINNHTLSFARAIGMMALSMDKDPSAGAPLVTGYDGQKRRLEDYGPIAMDAYLRNVHIARTKDGRGGMSPEGSMYSALGLRFEMSLRLAMLTAGVNTPASGLGRSSLYNHPFWDHTVPTYMATLFNKGQIDVSPDESYQGKVYERIAYGDVQNSTWQTMVDWDYFAALGTYDMLAGQTQRADQMRWILLHAMPGGAAKLGSRYDSALIQVSIRGGLLSYLLMDPDSPQPDEISADPRNNQQLSTYIPDLGAYIGRTGWGASDRILAYKNGWSRIDHNHGDGNSFDFIRKGRALTRKWLAYGQIAGQSDFMNTIAIKNYCGGPNGAAGNMSNGVFQPATGTMGGVHASGSQQYMGAATQAAYNAYLAAYNANPNSDFWMDNSPMDPKVLAISDSANQPYAYITGDSTILYNRWNKWEPGLTCEDVTHASRSLVWIKPDHLVIYDRATTGHSGFKRFWIGVPPAGYTSSQIRKDMSHIQIVPGANDVLSTVSLPAITNSFGSLSTTYEAQNLYLRTLLPTPSGVNVSKNNLYPDAGYDLSAGSGQIVRARIMVEASGDPTDTRFLHVLQGADAGVAADAASVIRSSDNALEGAAVKGWVVLFPKSLGSVPTSFSYTAPANTTSHLLTGLLVSSKYTVTQQAGAGGIAVTVSLDAAGNYQSDASGALLVQ